MKQIHFLTIAITCVALGGCVPATYVEVPALRGRVIDSQGKPLGNATVEIAEQRVSQKPIVSATVHADAFGVFRRPEQSRFAVFLPGLDPIELTYSVTAKWGDQHSSSKEVHNGFRVWLLQWPKTEDVGDLRVPPSPSP